MSLPDFTGEIIIMLLSWMFVHLCVCLSVQPSIHLSVTHCVHSILLFARQFGGCSWNFCFTFCWWISLGPRKPRVAPEIPTFLRGRGPPPQTVHIVHFHINMTQDNHVWRPSSIGNRKSKVPYKRNMHKSEFPSVRDRCDSLRSRSRIRFGAVRCDAKLCLPLRSPPS